MSRKKTRWQFTLVERKSGKIVNILNHPESEKKDLQKELKRGGKTIEEETMSDKDATSKMIEIMEAKNKFDVNIDNIKEFSWMITVKLK